MTVDGCQGLGGSELDLCQLQRARDRQGALPVELHQSGGWPDPTARYCASATVQGCLQGGLAPKQYQQYGYYTHTHEGVQSEAGQGTTYKPGYSCKMRISLTPAAAVNPEP